MSDTVGHSKSGLVAVMVLISMTVVLGVGLLVLYQAMAAYQVAQERWVCIERTYALESLMNYAINTCIVAERAHSPIKKTVQQFPAGYSHVRQVYDGVLTITPYKQGYHIIAQLSTAYKRWEMSCQLALAAHGWRVSQCRV